MNRNIVKVVSLVTVGAMALSMVAGLVFMFVGA